MPEPHPRGVFAGLATLDVIHRIDESPGRNEKVTAHAQFVAAGGPAANAAVTFAALGGEAILLTVLGSGPIAEAVTAELAGVNVHVIDIAPDLVDTTPVSSVSVIASTGERSVVGGDAAAIIAPAPRPEELARVLADADVVLLDGHHPQLAIAVAAGASDAGVPSVLDAGRWKDVMPGVIDQVTDVVASADFRVPGASTSEETAARLVSDGSPIVILTAGAEPVRWWSAGTYGEVPVPTVDAVDTLGAGDVFHGAYAYALARGADIKQRIVFANEVAATRCATVGPRSWLRTIARIPLDQGDR